MNCIHRLTLTGVAALGLLAAGPAVRASTQTLFVANYTNGAVSEITPAGAVSVFVSIGNAENLAFDAAGNLYVANAGNNIIEKVTPGGAVTPFATAADTPTGLAFDAAGNLYVALYYTNEIEKFTPAGAASVFASAGLDGPVGLAFDTEGNLYAANNLGNTIEEFTPDGAASVFASAGLDGPAGLAFDTEGNLYAANNLGNAIEKFTPGAAASVFATGVQGPTGITFDTDGNLYATLYNNSAIEEFAPTGAASVFVNTGLDQPGGLAFPPVPQQQPSPVISSVLTASGQAGQAFSYQITASNTPASFGASGLPAGLSVDAVSGLISGTPTVSGTFNVSLSATNAGGTGAAVLTITLAPALPAPPVISSVLTASGQAGQAFSYQITASNTPTAFGASGLPAGLNVDAGTGIISGTPTASGTFIVGLSATNVGGTGSAVLTVTLAPALPVVTLAATVAQVVAGSGDAGEFTLSLSAPQSGDLVIYYTIKGTAINGIDYDLIKGHKKIKAGKTSKIINIVPQGDLEGSSKKVVALALSSGNGYTTGTTGKVKVKILSGQ